MKRLLLFGSLIAVVACGESLEPIINPGEGVTTPIAGTYRLVSVNDQAVPTQWPEFKFATIDSGGLEVNDDGVWSQIEFVHAPGTVSSSYWGGYMDLAGAAVTLTDSSKTRLAYTGTVEANAIVLTDRRSDRRRYVRIPNAPLPSAYIGRSWVRQRQF